MGFLRLGNRKSSDKNDRGRHLLPSSLSSPEPLHLKLSPSRATNIKHSRLSMESDDSLPSPIADNFMIKNASNAEPMSSSITARLSSTADAEPSCVIGYSDELLPKRPLVATSPAADHMQKKREAAAFKRKPGSIPDSDVSDSDVSSATVISSHLSDSQQQQQQRTHHGSNASNEKAKLSKSKTTFELASDTLLARMKERHREECRRSWQSSEPFRARTQLVRSISAMPGRVADDHTIMRTSSILAQPPYNPARYRKQRVSIEEPPMTTRKTDHSTSWPTDPSSSKRHTAPSQLPPTPPPESHTSIPFPRRSLQHKVQYVPMVLTPKPQEEQEKERAEKSSSPTEFREKTPNCLQDILVGSNNHEKIRQLCDQLNVLLSQSAMPLMILPLNGPGEPCINAQHYQQYHQHHHHCHQRHHVSCCHHSYCCHDNTKKRQSTHINKCRHKTASAERTAGPCAVDKQ